LAFEVGIEFEGHLRLLDDLDDFSVNDGAEGLHEIVGESVRVVAVVVVDAEDGVEPGGGDVTGDSGAKDGIAVVEEGVDEGI
jgi:hypothetical protein